MNALARAQRGPVDFALAGASAMLTAFSLGMGLSYAPLGFFFVGVIALGTIASLLIGVRLQSSRSTTVSFALYALMALMSPFISAQVNEFLPGGGFPRELSLSAAPLCWMVALGSFVAWRDQTLLFQSVPCIALFGLVGAFNTFDGATITFFAFLLCSCLLYARSHQRAMLSRAERSGYLRLDSIHAGPWRWMAGPEWGIASAAVIILISALGAPIIQISMKQVSGVVTIRPPSVQPPAPTSLPGGVSFGGGRRVGQGPIGRLSEREVFRYKGPEPRYLRIATFNTYVGGAWSHVSLGNAVNAQQPDNASPFPFLGAEDIRRNFERTAFKLKFSGGAMSKAPIPTPLDALDEEWLFDRSSDGTISLRRLISPDKELGGTYFARHPNVKVESAPRKALFAGRYLDVDGATPRVVEVARSFTARPGTDYEHALAIKSYIEGRCKYNLNAEAAPNGEDPVDNFVFGPKKEGYCDLFASTMALMARAAKIPSRYVVGYFPAENETDDGWYVLRESNAHAWAELYFDGVGWIPFDATEGATEVPGGGVGFARDQVPLLQRPWFQTTLISLIGAIIVGTAFAVYRLTHRPLSKAQLQVAKLGQAYDRFVSSVEGATGQTRKLSESPYEFVERVGAVLGATLPTAQTLVARFSDAFYGRREWSDEDIDAQSSAVAAFQQEVAAITRQRRKHNKSSL